MKEREQKFSSLCRALENKVGKRMHSSKDYVYLSECIYEETHQLVSASTLKRLWGYLDEGVTPRRSTLDLLSQFLGYSEWDDFCAHQTTDEEKAEAPLPSSEAPGNSETPERPAPRRSIWQWALAALLCALLLLVLFLWQHNSLASSLGYTGKASATAADKYILKKGQTFESYTDYLHLFGITAQETWWYQPVPHHDGIKVWSPQYQHPQWHNEGNPDSLMPTITEYWEPSTPSLDEEAKMILNRMHAESYHIARNLNDVRITFMRGLKDSTFTFLGIYRLSLEKSDSTRLVYERIAEECDLRALDYLEQLRR